MNIKPYRRWPIDAMGSTLILFVLSTASVALGIDSDYSRKSLKGIKGLHVLVEDLTAATKEAGFSKQKILRVVEAKLRIGGIRPLTQDQHLRIKGQPYLYVAFSALRNPEADNLIVYYINVELIQNVILERNPKVLVDAPTWSINKIGATHRTKQVRNELKDFVDVFLTAYASVNAMK